MLKIILFLLYFSLICVPYNSFGLFYYKVAQKYIALNKVETPIVEEQQPEEEQPEEVVTRKIILNNTLDLDGYCTIKTSSSYFNTLEETTFTTKYLRYKDKKSKIIMSYITGISEDTDIPGYITQQLAGLDIVTNSKHEVDYETGKWMVIPAEKVIDGSYPTVYYKLDEDEATAFWMRVNRNENMNEEDTQKLEEVVTAMINSYKMYYSKGTVFETPTTGIYAEGNIPGSETVANPDGKKENSENNNVWQSGNEGFDFNAPVALNWESMEILIDGQKLKLPCTLEDILQAGFKVNDNKVKTEEFFLLNGTVQPVLFSNNNGTNVEFLFVNDSKSDKKYMRECQVVKLTIDTSTFIAKVNEEEKVDPTPPPQEGEQETDENGEEILSGADNLGQAEEEEKVFDDISAQHVVILPCGIMTNAYTEDIIKWFGEPIESKYENGNTINTWRKNEKYITLECGVVKNIKRITMCVMEGQ